jgi:hypothetical protein
MGLATGHSVVEGKIPGWSENQVKRNQVEKKQK